MQKYLRMSIKSSNFVRFFAKKQHVWPLAIELEGLRVTGYPVTELTRIVVYARRE